MSENMINFNQVNVNKYVMSDFNEDDDDSNKIFVGNIPFDCQKDEFFDMFKDEEGFVNAYLVINYHNDKSNKGFGYVKLNNYQNAKRLMERKIILGDRELLFEEYKLKSEDTKSKKFKLFIRGIPENNTADEFISKLNLMEDINIGSIKLNRNKQDNKPTGTGVLFIDDYNDMKKLLDQKEIYLDNKLLNVYPYRPNKNSFDEIIKKNKGNILNAVKAAYQAGFEMGLGSKD